VKVRQAESEMIYIDKLGQFVENRIRELEISQREVARRGGIDPNYISRLKSGVQLGSFENLIGLAKGLDLRPGVLFDVLAGRYNEPEILPATTERVVELSDDLLDEDIDFIIQTINMVTERRRYALDRVRNSSGVVQPSLENLRKKYRNIQRFLPTKKEMEEMERARLLEGSQVNPDKNKITENSQ
jgi:transcriptional regulator with XRE-family HTH domain